MPIKQATVGVIIKGSVVGMDGVDQTLKNTKKEVADLPSAAAKAGTALGAMFAGVAATGVAAVKHLVDAAEAVDKLSRVSGLPVEFLSGFTAAASTAKVSTAAVGEAITHFASDLRAVQGPGANVQAELMRLADQFQKMPDGPQKAALAMQAFGTAGAEMIPLLNQGSAEIERMMQHAGKLGQVLDRQGVESAKKLAAEMEQLSAAAEGFANRVAGGVIPYVVKGFQDLNHAIDVATTQSTILDAWVKIQTGAQLTQDELIKLKGALDEYKESMMGSSSMTDGMVQALDNVGYGADTAAGALDRASRSAIASSQAAEIASRNYMAAYSRFLSLQAAAVVGTQQVLSDAYASQYKSFQLQQKITLQGKYDIETLRAKSLAEQGVTAAVDAANDSLDKQLAVVTGGAKGMRDMAKATDEAADAQDELKKRTDAIGNSIGASTKPMDKMEQLQTAWKLATGQVTLEQLRQEEAMKALTASYDAGSVSMSDVLATLLAFRNGQIDLNRVFEVAGDAAKPLRDEINKLYTDMGAGVNTYEQFSKGIDALPNAKKVELSAGVAPGTVRALDDLHERLAAIQDRTVTITVMVAGMEQLGSLFPGIGKTGSQPIGGGGSGWVDPNRGSLGNGGTPNAGTSDSPPGEGRGGVTSVTIQMDSKAVGKAVINNSAGAARQDKKRNYR